MLSSLTSKSDCYVDERGNGDKIHGKCHGWTSATKLRVQLSETVTSVILMTRDVENILIITLDTLLLMSLKLILQIGNKKMNS